MAEPEPPTKKELDWGFKASLGVWGLLIGAALFYVSRQIAPDPRVRWILLGLLVFEGLTIVDWYRGNTLSEAMWFLARRPLIPLLFGIGLGWGVGLGLVQSFSFTLGILYGHFFWQQHKD